MIIEANQIHTLALIWNLTKGVSPPSPRPCLNSSSPLVAPDPLVVSGVEATSCDSCCIIMKGLLRPLAALGGSSKFNAVAKKGLQSFPLTDCSRAGQKNKNNSCTSSGVALQRGQSVWVSFASGVCTLCKERGRVPGIVHCQFLTTIFGLQSDNVRQLCSWVKGLADLDAESTERN